MPQAETEMEPAGAEARVWVWGAGQCRGKRNRDCRKEMAGRRSSGEQAAAAVVVSAACSPTASYSVPR